MPNKILIYYEQDGYGGVDMHLSQLVNHWPNHEDQFIILSNPDNEGLSFLKNLLYNSAVTIRTLDNVFINKAQNYSKLTSILEFFRKQYRFIKAFMKFIDELSPDIILSNNGGYPGGITNWLAAIIGKRMESTRNHTYMLVHHAPIARRRDLVTFYSGLLSQQVQRLDVPVLTVSKASKAALETFTPLKNLQVIYNGLEFKTDDVTPYDFKGEWYIPKNRVIVGMIGPIDPHKGHATMLKAFRASNTLQYKAHLVIVGSGREEMVGVLKDRIRMYGLDETVTFTGFLPGDSHSIIAGFDILVMPTIDFEGFGYSMAEGMASGIPVVASRVGAIPEVIEDGISGVLIEPNDILYWRKSLEDLIHDAERREVIGDCGKKRIEKEFSAKKMSQLYFDYITAY